MSTFLPRGKGKGGYLCLSTDVVCYLPSNPCYFKSKSYWTDLNTFNSFTCSLNLKKTFFVVQLVPSGYLQNLYNLNSNHPRYFLHNLP